MRHVSRVLVVLVEARDEKVLLREGLGAGWSTEDRTGRGASKGDEGGGGSSMVDEFDEIWPRGRECAVISASDALVIEIFNPALCGRSKGYERQCF